MLNANKPEENFLIMSLFLYQRLRYKDQDDYKLESPEQLHQLLNSFLDHETT